jgi:integrase
MGRPPLAVGTFGKIDFYRADNGSVRARANFRDYDGVRRQVYKWAGTQAAAERALRGSLRDRSTPTDGDITPSATISALAEHWLAEIDDSQLSVNTKRVYHGAVRAYITPALGALRIREARVQVIDRALKAIKAAHGAGAAKTTRSVLSSMFATAVRHGALSTNPVRDTSPIAIAKRHARALTVDEVERMTTLLRASSRSVELDLPDFVDWMLGTGMRIGETCAVRRGTNQDGQQLLDLVSATFEVNATMVRERGRGLVIQERPKTAAGWRVLALPANLIAMLERRYGEPRLQGPPGVVFPSAAGKLRDPSNTSGDLREMFDALECQECNGTGYQINADGDFRAAANGRRIRCEAGPWSWLTSHVFRKTVATRLDEAGHSAREIADQLGHEKPSMTQDVYMGRRVVSVAAARTLNRQ